jgi:hypothetical protein
MTEVALINFEAGYLADAVRLRKIRSDLKFPTYGSLDDVEWAHGFFVVNLDILSMSNKGSINRFLLMSKRLLQNEGTRYLPAPDTSNGRNFRSFKDKVILLLPTVEYATFMIIDCAQGSASVMDIKYALSNLTMAYPNTHTGTLTIDKIVQIYLPAGDAFRVDVQKDVAEITSYDKGRFTALDLKDNALSERMQTLTVEIVELTEVVKGDNSLLGTTIKRQLLSTLDGIRVELNAPLIDKPNLENKTDDVKTLSNRLLSATDNAEKITTRMNAIVLAVHKLLQWVL